MNSLNSILLEGNATRQPELKNTPKGTSVCTFTVASNRFFRMGESTQKEVSFFDVETWSSLAERCAQEINKGRGVRVVGHLKQDRWQDTEGKPRSSIRIVAEHVEFKPVANKANKDLNKAIANDSAVADGKTLPDDEEDLDF